MITPDSTLFPTNAVAVLVDRVQTIDAGLTVLERPLRLTDPHQCVGIWGTLWMPDGDSWETSRAFPGEPTVSKYTVTIQSLVRDADQQRGLGVHATLSAKIRALLVRDSTTRVALSSLTATLEGATEHMMRWKVTNQELMQNQVKTGWAFMSVSNIELQTAL